jgi:steroid delta-isomerase-like uncharacterized protein
MATEEPRETLAGTATASGMTRDEIVALFDRRQAAYDNLDAAALAADYAEDAVISSPTTGTHTGRAAAESTLRTVFSAFADLKITRVAQIVDGDHVAQVLRMEGTNLGGFLGLPASGRKFGCDAAFFFELRDRHIVRERRIYDFTGLLVQVGVLKARPG